LTSKKHTGEHDCNLGFNEMNNMSNGFLIDRHCGAILLLLVISAFIIRCVFANAQIIASDGFLYIEVAKNIFSGNFEGVYEYGFFNLYSFLIALFQMIFHNWELSGKMVSVLFGSLTVIPLFLFIKEIFDIKVAFVSTVFYTIHPRFVEYASDILREPTCWFFSALAIWLAWVGISRKKWFVFVLSGLSTGLAMFTRSEGILICIVVILWISWWFLREKEQRKEIVAYMAIYVLSLPLLMAPFLFLLKENTHNWELGHPIEKVAQLIRSNDNKEIQPMVSDKSPGEKKGSFELSGIYRFGASLLDVLYKFVKAFNVVLIFLFLCGICRRRSIPYSQGDVILLIWITVVFLGLLSYLTKVGYLGTRHGLLMAFPSLAWSGVGFFEVRDRVRKWVGSKRLFQRYARFDTFFLIILILIILVPQTVFSLRNDKVELKKAGVELKQMGFSNTVFMVQPTLSRIAFYADAKSIPLLDKIDNNTIKALAKEHHATLLIIDERTIDDYAPGIRKVIEQSKFQKLAISEMGQYRKYSFSIYKIQ
jgi:4-amino-4-deoxy-L-arabinose transferase-like glycosyltransferase